MALFKVTDDIVLKDYSFRPLTLKDKAMFDACTSKMDYHNLIWEHSFTLMFVYEKQYPKLQLIWKKIDDFIFVFEYSKRTGRIWMFGLPFYEDADADFKVAFYKAMKIMADVNGTNSRSVILYVTQKVDDLFTKEGLKKVEGKKYREAEDFVYRCTDLMELKGKPYKSRRGMVNRLKRDHPDIIVRLATDDDIDGIMAVRNKWLNKHIIPMLKPTEKVESAVIDYNSFDTIIKYRKKLGYILTVAEENGKIIGFFMQSTLASDCLSVLKENVDLDYSGLSEYMWYESLKFFPNTPEFENDGNGGYKRDDGLYLYKMSHHPSELIYKNSYKLNKTGDPVDFESILSDDYIKYLKKKKVW